MMLRFYSLVDIFYSFAVFALGAHEYFSWLDILFNSSDSKQDEIFLVEILS